MTVAPLVTQSDFKFSSLTIYLLTIELYDPFKIEYKFLSLNIPIKYPFIF